MSVAQATSADLDDLIWLFAGYLTFYEVPQPAGPVREFLGARLARGDSAIFLARDDEGRAQGFVQLYPLFSSLSLRPAWLLNDLFWLAIAASCLAATVWIVARAKSPRGTARASTPPISVAPLVEGGCYKEFQQ